MASAHGEEYWKYSTTLAQVLLRQPGDMSQTIASLLGPSDDNGQT